MTHEAQAGRRGGAEDLLEQGKLHRHPHRQPYLASATGPTPPDPKEPLRRELPGLFQKLESAYGFSRAQLRVAAIALLQDEEWGRWRGCSPRRSGPAPPPAAELEATAAEPPRKRQSPLPRPRRTAPAPSRSRNDTVERRTPDALRTAAGPRGRGVARALAAPGGRAEEKDRPFLDKDLAGWDGLKEYWSYKDGALVGGARGDQVQHVFVQQEEVRQLRVTNKISPATTSSRGISISDPSRKTVAVLACKPISFLIASDDLPFAFASNTLPRRINVINTALVSK